MATAADERSLTQALRLIYIVDLDTARDWERMDQVLGAGATSVWLRAPEASGADLYRTGSELVWRCHERGAAVFIGDRADVALAAGADGVQLGFRSPPVRKVRPWFPGWVGSSCHSDAELRKAERGGADFCVLSPVFGVPSKGSPLGTVKFDRLARASSLPVVALGGIDESTMEGLSETAAAGIAVIRALRDAPDPQQVARALAATVTPR